MQGRAACGFPQGARADANPPSSAIGALDVGRSLASSLTRPRRAQAQPVPGGQPHYHVVRGSPGLGRDPPRRRETLLPPGAVENSTACRSRRCLDAPSLPSLRAPRRPRQWLSGPGAVARHQEGAAGELGPHPEAPATFTRPTQAQCQVCNNPLHDSANPKYSKY